ncbi:LysR family transcriptional regulator [Fodinicola feengrottensis]|uniref:LysR family transcriptional regulator n=1 Tax=Fodinicola feengrottensis TaxID=435914 RepID=A0ABN2FWJ6_9ACTN
MTSAHDFAWADLRVFCEVARLGSFTAAAEPLGYTQPGVSRRIAALERTVGGPLFARQARGVRLTPVGEALHRHAVDILGRLEAAAAEMSAVSRGTAGRLRIGSFHSANAALVPATLRRFINDFPLVETNIHEAVSPELLDALRGGTLDVAVVSDYPSGALDADSVRLIHLLDDPLLVALPRTHPFANAAAVHLRDLAEETWIQASPQPLLLAACARAGFQPSKFIDVHSWIAKPGFVAAGLGISLLPGLAVAAMRADIAIVPVLDEIAPRQVFATVLAQDAPSPAAAAFITYLQEWHSPECVRNSLSGR